MQKMMNVDEPDYGHLLDDMQVFEDKPVLTSKYLLPRVEVEVGFVLADDLPGAGCTEDDVLAATAAFAPAIELRSTPASPTGRSSCATPSPTTRPRPAGCSARSGCRQGHRAFGTSTPCSSATARCWARAAATRGARQSGDGGRVAGAQGRSVRRASQGRRRRAAGCLHAGVRCQAG